MSDDWEYDTRCNKFKLAGGLPSDDDFYDEFDRYDMDDDYASALTGRDIEDESDKGKHGENVDGSHHDRESDNDDADNKDDEEDIHPPNKKARHSLKSSRHPSARSRALSAPTHNVAIKRGRGRPKGSKTKTSRENVAQLPQRLLIDREAAIADASAKKKGSIGKQLVRKIVKGRVVYVGEDGSVTGPERGASESETDSEWETPDLRGIPDIELPPEWDHLVPKGRVSLHDMQMLVKEGEMREKRAATGLPQPKGDGSEQRGGRKSGDKADEATFDVSDDDFDEDVSHLSDEWNHHERGTGDGIHFEDDEEVDEQEEKEAVGTTIQESNKYEKGLKKNYNASKNRPIVDPSKKMTGKAWYAKSNSLMDRLEHDDDVFFEEYDYEEHDDEDEIDEIHENRLDFNQPWLQNKDRLNRFVAVSLTSPSSVYSLHHTSPSMLVKGAPGMSLSVLNMPQFSQQSDTMHSLHQKCTAIAAVCAVWIIVGEMLTVYSLVFSRRVRKQIIRK